MKPRLLKLRQLLKVNSIDAVIISSLANITYLTDFSGFTNEDRDAYLLITQKSQYIFTHALYREVAQKYFTDFTFVEYNRSNPFSAAIKNIIATEKISKLGYEGFDLTVNDFDVITKEIKNTILVSLDLVSKLRIIKDSNEIRYIKNACSLGDKVYKYILTHIKKGITEKELSLLLEIFIKKNGSEISFAPIIAFGPNASQPHHVPDNTKLKNNNLILFDFGVKLNNYCSDMTRTVFFGNAKNEQKKAYLAVIKSQNEAISYIQNNLKLDKDIISNEVDATSRNYLIHNGYDSIPHSLGHGIGLHVHESPRLTIQSNESLVNGMVFSIEPGIYVPDNYGIRIEDIFAIENNSLKQLTKSPKQFTQV